MNRCPQKHELAYSTTDRNGFRLYKSDSKVCSRCPVLLQCTRSQKKQKVITRHVWEDSKELTRQNRLSPSGKYRLRYQTIERSFADAKELHGLRYCRLRAAPGTTSHPHAESVAAEDAHSFGNTGHQAEVVR